MVYRLYVVLTGYPFRRTNPPQCGDFLLHEPALQLQLLLWWSNIPHGSAATQYLAGHSDSARFPEGGSGRQAFPVARPWSWRRRLASAAKVAGGTDRRTAVHTVQCVHRALRIKFTRPPSHCELDGRLHVVTRSKQPSVIHIEGGALQEPSVGGSEACSTPIGVAHSGAA